MTLALFAYLCRAALVRTARIACAAGLAATTLAATAQQASAADGAHTIAIAQQQARELALASAKPAEGLRAEVEVGQLNARLKLAPCARIEPYLPPSFRAWGRSKVGLRCIEGPTHWNVYLPVTIKVYGQALVATRALAAGSVVDETDVRLQEVDLAAAAQAAITDTTMVVGHTLARGVMAGDALREGSVRPRQYFAAGETVRVVAAGAGFTVQTEGQAMSAGFEGSTVRVRTASGRIVSGTASAERQIDVAL